MKKGDLIKWQVCEKSSENYGFFQQEHKFHKSICLVMKLDNQKIYYVEKKWIKQL